MSVKTPTFAGTWLGYLMMGACSICIAWLGLQWTTRPVEYRNNLVEFLDGQATLGTITDRLAQLLDQASTLAASGHNPEVREGIRPGPYGLGAATFDFVDGDNMLALDRGNIFPIPPEETVHPERAWRVSGGIFSGSVQPHDVSVSVSLSFANCVSLSTLPPFWVPSARGLEASRTISRWHADTQIGTPLLTSWGTSPWTIGLTPPQAFDACAGGLPHNDQDGDTYRLTYRFVRS